MRVPFPTDSPAPFAARLRDFAARRSGWLFTLLIVGLLVLIQWPMLKGSVYRLSGAEPPERGIAWRTDFHAAAQESAETGKPMLVDFTASWCPPCQLMEHEVWPDQRVAGRLERDYIPVKLDVDERANQQIQARYGVRAIPTIMVMDAKGHVLKQANYLSADGMVAFLDEGLAPFK